MKKVLIIDESEVFRDYLMKKFSDQGFEVAAGINGLDGSLKLRKILPDLIITDFMLSRKSCLELLIEKHKNPNASHIPVILLTTKIDKSKVVELAKYGVKKIYSKPVKIDSLFAGVSELLKIKMEVDDTPCIIETNFNDEILFIEVARGLNTEKIDILKFRINEIMKIYGVTIPKILLMVSNFELENKDIYKFRTLLEILLSYTDEKTNLIKILTSAKTIQEYVSNVTEFKGIKVSNNLGDALDELIGQKGDHFAQDRVVEENLLSSRLPDTHQNDKIEMRFEAEELFRKLDSIGDNIKLAIVDDDLVIRQLLKTVFKPLSWQIDLYENGKKFVDAVQGKDYDLIFLDLMMPELDGFGVMEYMKKNNLKTPVIILSALTQKETVLKAVTFGVKSYMTKPLKPDAIKRKTAEILNPEF